MRFKIVGILRYFGILSILSSWITIITSILLNPWFKFAKNAFSDLGASNACMPWIFNYGLMITGVLIILYSFAQFLDSMNILEYLGSGYTNVMGIFLMLIGLYPTGTYPHTFVSVWFFIQGDLAIAVWGLGLIIRRWYRLGLSYITLALISPIIAYIIKWPSIATLEVFGILVLDIWIITLFKIHLRGNLIR